MKYLFLGKCNMVKFFCEINLFDENQTIYKATNENLEKVKECKIFNLDKEFGELCSLNSENIIYLTGLAEPVLTTIKEEILKETSLTKYANNKVEVILV